MTDIHFDSTVLVNLVFSRAAVEVSVAARRLSKALKAEPVALSSPWGDTELEKSRCHLRQQMPPQTAGHSHARPHWRVRTHVRSRPCVHLHPALGLLLPWHNPPEATGLRVVASHHQITAEGPTCSTAIKYLKKPVLKASDLRACLSWFQLGAWSPGQEVQRGHWYHPPWTPHGLHYTALRPTLAPFPRTCFPPSLQTLPDPSGTSAEKLNTTRPTAEPRKRARFISSALIYMSALSGAQFPTLEF